MPYLVSVNDGKYEYVIEDKALAEELIRQIRKHPNFQNVADLKYIMKIERKDFGTVGAMLYGQ